MNVYVVNSGEYSNYKIEGIYSTQEKAEKMVATLNRIVGYSEPSWYEYELDSDPIPAVIPKWTSTINIATGELQDYTFREVEEGTLPDPGSLLACAIQRIEINKNLIEGFYTAYSSKSQEHARKLCIEGRQAILRKLTELDIQILQYYNKEKASEK